MTDGEAQTEWGGENDDGGGTRARSARRGVEKILYLKFAHLPVSPTTLRARNRMSPPPPRRPRRGHPSEFTADVHSWTADVRTLRERRRRVAEVGAENGAEIRVRFRDCLGLAQLVRRQWPAIWPKAERWPAAYPPPQLPAFLRPVRPDRASPAPPTGPPRLLRLGWGRTATSAQATLDGGCRMEGLGSRLDALRRKRRAGRGLRRSRKPRESRIWYSEPRRICFLMIRLGS